MMIMICGAKAKAKKLAAAGAMALLLGVAVPFGYNAMTDVGAMSLFAAGDNVAAEMVVVGNDSEASENKAAEDTDSENLASENLDVKNEAGEKSALWQAVYRVIFGEEQQIIRY